MVSKVKRDAASRIVSYGTVSRYKVLHYVHILPFFIFGLSTLLIRGEHGIPNTSDKRPVTKKNIIDGLHFRSFLSTLGIMIRDG